MGLENINSNVSFNSVNNLNISNNASNSYGITKIKNYNGININNQNLNYNMEYYDIEDIEDDVSNNKGLNGYLAETGATNIVRFNSIISGVYSVVEFIGDGVIWGGGTVASGVLDLFGYDEKAEEVRKGTKDLIKVDVVGDINKWFYEETELGRNINEKSRLKYDSEEAQKIQDITVKITEMTAAIVLTFGTGGAATPLVLGIGFLEGTGKSANLRYQDPNNEGYETGAIALDGIGNAFNWYSGGKLGAGALNFISAISQVGLSASVSTFSSIFKNAIKNFKVSNLFSKDIWTKAMKSGILDFDNFIDSAGVVVDNLTDYANGGELDVFKMVKELLTTYGLNCFFDGAASALLDANIVKGLGSEIGDVQSKVSRYNYLKSVIETDDYKNYAFKVFNDYTIDGNIPIEYKNIYSEFMNLKNELSDVDGIGELIDLDFDPDQAINSGSFAKLVGEDFGSGKLDDLDVGVTEVVDEFKFTDEVKESFGGIEDLEDVKLNKEINLSDNKFSKEQILTKLDFSPKVVKFLESNHIDIEKLYASEKCFLSETKVPEEDFFIYSTTKKDVSISDIIGMNDETNGKNILECLSLRYDERTLDSYQNRSLNILEGDIDNIINAAKNPTNHDNFLLKELENGKYVVGEDGKHRYTLLRLLYLNDTLKANDLEVDFLKKKYTIPCVSSKLEVDKSCCNYLFNYVKNNGESLKIEYDNRGFSTGNMVIDFQKYNDFELVDFIKKRMKNMDVSVQQKIYQNAPDLVKKFIDENSIFSKEYNNVDFFYEINVNDDVIKNKINIDLNSELLKYPNIELDKIQNFKNNGLSDDEIVKILPMLEKGETIKKSFNNSILDKMYNKNIPLFDVNYLIGWDLNTNAAISVFSKKNLEYFIKSGTSDIKMYDYFYNTDFGKFLTNCSEGELDSLIGYTGTKFKDYRSLDIDNNTEIMFLDSIINRYTRDCGDKLGDMMLYRGIDITQLKRNTAFGNLFKDVDLSDTNQVYSVLKKLEGRSIFDESFMSTSISSEVAESFLPDNGGIEFKIVAPSGTKGIYLDDISAARREFEFLLGRNTELLISDVSLGQKVDGGSKIVVSCIASSEKSPSKIYGDVIDVNYDGLKTVELTDFNGNKLKIDNIKDNYKQLVSDISIIEETKKEWLDNQKKLFNNYFDEFVEDGISNFEQYLEQLPSWQKEKMQMLQNLEEKLISFCI